ncbi:MAG: DUF5320 domain-containing protein [Desulfofustis sp. PB-SRB1]|nr:DUF5320 domain-containing protein [Desulfofustis sp. PB-SRB1]MBM1002158.1 DUF5320 domain-containing protein [Desulfofustis sp. PB-SRB1]
MPGFDGTGPQGNGPMSGGQRGRCGMKSRQTDQYGAGRSGRGGGGRCGRRRMGREVPAKGTQ